MSLLRAIAVVATLATATALLAVLLLFEPAWRKRDAEKLQDKLLSTARLVGRLVEPELRREGGEIGPLVRELARDSHVRITIMDPDTRVLSDSEPSADETAESREDGSEIRAALLSGSGITTRRRPAANVDDGYAAISLREGGRLLGLVRVAAPLEGLDDLHRAILAGFTLSVVLAVILATRVSHSFAAPLGRILRTAREIAAGRFEARVGPAGTGETAELGTVLNKALDEFQARLAEGARDRARTDAILSAMEDGVLAVDDRGIVILANDILRKNLGLNDPLGRHYVEVIRQREVGEVIEAVLKTGKRRAIEVRIRHLDRFVALSGVSFPGEEGSPSGAVLTFHDVTERRRLEQVRRDFVANASHELRTPLTSIRGFVEALEDGAANDTKTAERFLGKIHLHSDRMAALVEDLLELSRLESGERPPHWEEVSPVEVAEDVVASFSGLAERKGTTLIRSDRGAASVVTDADRLRRILENLVDNAVKYTPEGGRVEIATGPGNEGGAILEVADNGSGIPPEHLPRIFERFYRVDKARSRELGGTGLGLAIVKHLAEGMGARVSVRSEMGKGTCFTVTLPAGREHQVA